MKRILRFISDENGQGTTEYAILMAFIVIVVIIAINSLGIIVSNDVNNTGNQIDVM